MSEQIKTYITGVDRFTAVFNRFNNLAGSKIAAPIKKLQASMAGLALITTGAAASVGVMIKKYADTGNRLLDMSKKTRLSVEALQELEYAGKMNGVDDLTGSLKKFSMALGMASLRAGNERKAFRALGVDFKDANGKMKSTDQLLMETIDGLKGLENQHVKNKVASFLFGKSAIDLAVLIDQGSVGIQKAREEAKKFGLITEADAKAAGEFNDSVYNLQRSLTGLQAKLGGVIVPKLIPYIAQLTDYVVKNKDEISELFLRYARLGKGLLKFIEYVGPVKLVAFAISLKLVPAVWGAVVAIRALSLAMAMNPIGLLALALAGVGVAGYAGAKGIQALIEKQKYFDRWKNSTGYSLVSGNSNAADLQKLNDFYVKNLSSGKPVNEWGWTKDLIDLDAAMDSRYGTTASSNPGERAQQINGLLMKELGASKLPGSSSGVKLDGSLNINVTASGGAQATVNPSGSLPMNVNLGPAW